MPGAAWAWLAADAIKEAATTNAPAQERMPTVNVIATSPLSSLQVHMRPTLGDWVTS